MTYAILSGMSLKQAQDTAERIRRAIDSKRVIDRLMACIDGQELSSQQIAAARILLDKSLPDLKAIEHTGDVSGRFVIDWNK